MKIGSFAIAVSLAAAGCVSHGPQASWSSLAAVDDAVSSALDSGEATVVSRVGHDQRRLRSLCGFARDRIEARVASARDDETLVKTVAGSSVAGVTGILGTIAGITGAADTSPLDVGSPPLWFGVSSGAIALVGSIVTAAITPGQNEMQLLAQQTAEINAAIRAISEFLAANPLSGDGWDEARYNGGWSDVIGTAQSRCTCAGRDDAERAECQSNPAAFDLEDGDSESP